MFADGVDVTFCWKDLEFRITLSTLGNTMFVDNNLEFETRSTAEKTQLGTKFSENIIYLEKQRKDDLREVNKYIPATIFSEADIIFCLNIEKFKDAIEMKT